MNSIVRSGVFFLTGALCFIFSGCVTEPSALTGEKTSYGYTWSQELELGRSADGDIVKEMGLYPDEELSRYVVEVGERVLAESSLRREGAADFYRALEFEFRVLDSPVVNAFALPGGYVYVTRGLLAHLNNEAQLAVVLGHEITHVAGRHASKQALKAQWGQIGLMAGAVISSELTDKPELAGQVLEVGGGLFQLLSLKYGRDAERESDLFGVEYAGLAGYSVGEAAAFFDSLSRLSERSGQSIPSWMSSHPDPGERSQTILRLASEYDGQGEASVVEQRRFYDMIDGLSIGEDPRKGFREGGVFYHPELAFQFAVPSGWLLQNEASSVMLADSGKKALVAFSPSSAQSAEDAAVAFLGEIEGNEVSRSARSFNGLDAMVVEVEVLNGESVMMAHYTSIEFEGQVYSFMGYCSSEDYEGYRQAFESIGASFKRLTDREILDREPARLSIYPASRTAKFSELLPRRLPEGVDPLALAIMNQLNLDTVVERGTLLKLPME